MAKRPAAGRALFYTRDSGGHHETTPGQYVNWAMSIAEKNRLSFDGTPDRIEAMIRFRKSRDGDLFLDYGVTGNKLTRDGLDAWIGEAARDAGVSHLLSPRRDRLFRPDHPIDAMQFERRISEFGVTLVFMDRVVKPVAKGRRVDMGESICAFIDYNFAGEFRRDLAQKMIHAQISLAKDGFSTGGRPPFGFRRWLVRIDGTAVRQLSEGEYVKMAGHHVAWLPGPESEFEVIRRILAMLETMPASRVAAALTAERVPTPDAGRRRTDRGANHETSGVWSQATIVNIARNPLLLAIVSYGRRSMGDQLRFTPQGPRPLEDDDRRRDGQPKVVANPDSTRISAPASFEPLVDVDRQGKLIATLDARAGSQRGKPRSKTPEKNPLGARIFDMGCGWSLYRQPYNGSFRYLCGLYQQSHGASCRHNQVAGPAATQFVMGCIRQRVLTTSFRERLREKLRTIAMREIGQSGPDPEVAKLRLELEGLDRERGVVEGNMARASGEAQYKAIARVFDGLMEKQTQLEAELRRMETSEPPPIDIEAEVDAALKAADELAETEPDDGDLAAAGRLFQALNVNLYLDFKEIKQKKRTVNVVSKGILTFGMAEPPVQLYKGPTGRRALAANPISEVFSGGSAVRVGEGDPARGGKSLGNVSRGERI
jgi:hypothetical protein